MSSKRAALLGLCLLWVGAPSGKLSAQPVVESFDRFELNWSNMRIRFFGEAIADFSGRGFEDAEKSATEEGLLYALGNITQIRSKMGLGQATADFANSATKQAYVYNTTYFSDGRVRVDLESGFSKVFGGNFEPSTLPEPQSAGTDTTGIVVSASGVSAPIVVSSIRDKSGAIVFESKDVSQSSFRKNMLGRWFYAGSPELGRFVGPRPEVVSAEYVNGGFVVSEESWSKLKSENARLFEDARVAYVIKDKSKR